MTERIPTHELESGSRLDTYLRPLMAKLHAQLDATDGNIPQVVDSELTEAEVVLLDKFTNLLQIGNTFVMDVEKCLTHPDSVDIAAEGTALMNEAKKVGAYIKEAGGKMYTDGDFGRKALYGWINNQLMTFSMYPFVIQDGLNKGGDVGESLNELKDAVARLTELTRL